jgi:2-polyprenyl-6-methoxyphenol hydroxylase-like FAD-dependent oxidoreductase
MGQLEACGDTPFPHMTIIPQGTTEQVLYRRLNSDTNCKVNWNTELVSYVQEESRVIAVVKDRTTQQEETIESKYIIGADGSHSMVRKGNPDWTYEGTALKNKFAIADLTIHADDIEELINRNTVFMAGSSNVFV